MDQHPKVRTASDGALLLNFGQYGEEVEVAAISGDGRRVLTVHAVGIADVWDTRSGEKVGEVRPESPLQGSQGTAPVQGEFQVFIESAALNRDGSIALLGLNDGTAGTFRVQDGVRLATLHPPNERPSSEFGVIRAVAYSPDGAFALVGFPRRSVGIWSEQGDRPIGFFQAPSGSQLVGNPWVRDTLVSSVSISSDGRWVFAGNVDMTATIWDAQTGQVVFAATEHAEEILALFDSDDALGWATTGGSVWMSRGGELPTKIIASGEHWAEVRFDRDSFLTRGFDDAIKRWNFSGQCESLFSREEPRRAMWSDSAETLAFHEEWILYAKGGRRIGVRRAGDVTNIDRDAQLVKARFSPTGRAVATEGWRDYVELWEIPGGGLLHQFAAPGGVGDFAFSRDGALIAIGEIGQGGGRYARHVFVYDAASGSHLHRHSEHDWQVSHVEFSPDGRCLASLGEDVVLWELDLRRVTTRIEADRVTTGLRFLADGRLLVIDRGRARIFRDAKKILEWEAPVNFRTRWCVSQDERTLDIESAEGIIRFDLATGAVRGVRAAMMPRPEHVPPGALARQVNARSGAALWRTEHGLFLHQSDGPRGWVQPLHLSPDGVVAVPAQHGAAVFHVGSTTSLLGIVPFEGKLRASRSVDGELLLVNERGQLFRQRVPSHERRT